MSYYEDADELFQKTGLDLDDFIETDVEAGKHDVTNYYGFFPKDGFFLQASYEVSYNNGVQSITVDLQNKYIQLERTVTETYYKKV